VVRARIPVSDGTIMADAQKKVVVRLLGEDVLWGYLPQTGFVNAGDVEMLEVGGKVIHIDLNEIKTIAYVKDFNPEDAIDPERIGRKSFLGRPRGDGLWLKVTFRDGDAVEGLSHFDGGFMDGLIEDRGFRMTPPEARSNTQMLFVPRSALGSVEVLGYISAPAKKKAKSAAGVEQSGLLFED
jgi:hypothetical protein